MEPYLKSTQIFICPSATRRTTAGTGQAPINATAPEVNIDSSYFTNGVVVRNASSGGLNQAAIPNSAEIILMQEYLYVYGSPLAYPRRLQCAGGTSYYINFDRYAASAPSPPFDLSDTHFDGGNLLFVDGHVKWRKQSSILASEFGLNASPTCSTTPSGTAGSATDTNGSRPYASNVYFGAAF